MATTDDDSETTARDDVLRRIAVTRQVGARRALFVRIARCRTVRRDAVSQS
ncbi:hypothetical protein [Streptomyces griseoluteus]|uniref:hypothetical protein n=1 Tax=Streptomyces griseoluteus TaxID=29306 RepID=UPI0036E609AD